MKSHKNVYVLGAIALPWLLLAGCANLDRSRNLAESRVPPEVTARQVCADCHGADGVSTSPNFPRLAGQPADYLVSQLKNFRSKNRSDPAGYEYMWGLTRHLSDAQIAGLAAYFSRQAPQANRAAALSLVPTGKQIFEQGIAAKQTPACQVCHGQNAEGVAIIPRLAQQHQDYLRKQLRVFSTTEQRPDTPMKEVAHNLDEAEIEAVSAYLQGLPLAGG